MTDRSNEQSFRMFPIGYIRRNQKYISLEVLEAFRPALKQLDRFSHVMVSGGRISMTTKRVGARYSASLLMLREE